jgi:hypothetical protein
LQHLENSVIGDIVLVLIGVGMIAFAVWCAVDAWYDLDDRGSDARGIAARTGTVVSGLVAVGIGGIALLLLLADLGGAVADGAGGGAAGSAAGGSHIDRAVATVMDWPAGQWIVGGVGFAIIGNGVFQFVLAWNEMYRRYLVANRVTRRADWILKAGLAARGVIIGVIGLLFVFAAWWADPYEAGGVDEAFAWLTGQPYGWAIVAAICVGLLGYAAFCFVNAVYRFVPKVAPNDVEALETALKRRLQAAM